jgi:enoyl-[acyl-carrier-protein] reductase (NADH)
VEEEDILKDFKDRNLLLPVIKQADVINADDTADLFNYIKDEFGKVDIFISNVSFANLVKSMDDYNEGSLLKSIEYSTWPMIEYTRQMKNILGSYPRYVIGLSSHGPDRYYRNYDYAAATKSLNEVLIKYLTYHFYNDEVIFNIVRTRPLITDSLLSTIGQDWPQFIEKYDIPGTHIELEEIAKLVFILCSGLLDAVRGQTLNADKGYDFAEGLQRLFADQEELGL